MIASFGSEHYAITIFCSHPLFGANSPGKTALCVRNAYVKEKGANRNPANPLIFLARPARFELATYGFVVGKSLQAAGNQG